ncbi:MAG: tRNA (guanine-N1)-methyltransferase [Bacteroidota bacterium]
MKNLIILFIGLSWSFTSLHAQNQQDQNPTDDTSIQGQFETLIRKSTNYRQNGKRYEVVRLLEMNALQKNVLDTIKTANATIGTLKSTIAENETAISSLNTKLDETTKNLNRITEEKDSMPFFGSLVSKSTYKLIVWSIIIGLLIFLALFIFKFRNSNILTQQAKTALADLEDEYEQHRRRALEREQKISRELHDERNKNRKGA